MGQAGVGCDELAAELYDGLGPVRRAMLLNLFVKMKATTVATKVVWDYIRELDKVEVDRVYAYVCPDLLGDVEGEATCNRRWQKVWGGLHDAPKGYGREVSAKTKDDKGNLQVTLFKHRAAWSTATQVDADIDLEGRWWKHVGEALRNHLTGSKTHPGIVYQVLLRYQGLEPHPDFEVSGLLKR